MTRAKEHLIVRYLFRQYTYYVIVIVTVLVVCKDGITLLLLLLTKKHLYIERAGLNPFKNIYKVLKYSWKHKVPEHRSAFTYWEEDIPRRIDLGKRQVWRTIH